MSTEASSTGTCRRRERLRTDEWTYPHPRQQKERKRKHAADDNLHRGRRMFTVRFGWRREPSALCSREVEEEWEGCE
jgi:hypothetical protein